MRISTTRKETTTAGTRVRFIFTVRELAVALNTTPQWFAASLKNWEAVRVRAEGNTAQGITLFFGLEMDVGHKIWVSGGTEDEPGFIAEFNARELGFTPTKQPPASVYAGPADPGTIYLPPGCIPASHRDLQNFPMGRAPLVQTPAEKLLHGEAEPHDLRAFTERADELKKACLGVTVLARALGAKLEVNRTTGELHALVKL